MKMWKLFVAVALAGVAVLLVMSLGVAAPVSASGAQIDRVTDDPLESVVSDTLPMTHPVGILIALYFNIPYTHVVELHEAGFGFGTIARAYLTAYQSKGILTPEQILAMRQAGTGWGQIKKEDGIHPGGNGLGTIVRQHGTPQPAAPQPPNAPPAGNEQGKKDQGGNTAPAIAVTLQGTLNLGKVPRSNMNGGHEHTHGRRTFRGIRALE